MIDKVFIHKHQILKGQARVDLPDSFSSTPHQHFKIVPIVLADPDHGIIVAVEVELRITLKSGFYDFQTRTEFIIKGSPDFTSPHDLQRLAELCLIAFHQAGQQFAQSEIIAFWNKERVEEISIESILADLKSGKISIGIPSRSY